MSDIITNTEYVFILELMSGPETFYEKMGRALVSEMRYLGPKRLLFFWINKNSKFCEWMLNETAVKIRPALSQSQTAGL